MRRTPIPLAALCCAVALFPTPQLSAQVDPDTARAIVREGLEGSRVMDILDRLTNGIGHRLTGSDNFTRACDWAVEEFRSFGMEQVEKEHWATWPITWNRGQWMGRIVLPEPMELQVATSAWTNGTKGLVRGPILAMPKNAEELEALGDAIDGAYLAGEFPSRRDPFREALLIAVNDRTAGFVYPSSGDARFPNRMRVFGSFPRSDEIPDAPPSIMVRRDQFERLEEMLAAGQPVVAEFDIRNRWRREPIDLHNVIAEIPGTEKPEEVVYVCGHLDSWHQATGTTDNGTGSASTLEAARILMAVGAKPKRTIRFALWGGEEQGLIGSNRHVTMRRSSMDQVSAVFNHDTGTNWAQSLTVQEAAVPMLEQVFAPVLELLTPPDAGFEGPVFALKGAANLGRGGGSDHASFLRAGVPAYPWGLEGRADYFRYSWHSQWDTYQAAIPEYMRHTATVIALAALGTANLPEMLPRDGVGRAQGTDLQPMLEGFLGVELDDEKPLRIESVKDAGVASNWGLRGGDQLVSLAGRELEDLVDVVRALRGSDDGKKLKLVIQRGDQRVELEVERD